MVKKIFALAVTSVVLWGAEAKQPDQWWKENPLSTTLLEEWKWHGEVTYDYTHELKTEQYEETVHKGKAYGAVRKGRWTNHTVMAFTDEEVVGKSDETEGISFIDNHSVSLDNFLMYALDSHWSAEAGYMYTEDNIRQVDSRHTVYAGADYSYRGGQYFFSLFSALGHEEVEYAVETENDGGMVLYTRQNYSQPIVENVTFEEDFAYVLFLEDTDIYRTDLLLSLDIALSKHLSFVVSYSNKYDSTPVSGLSKRQTGQLLGLKFSF